MAEGGPTLRELESQVNEISNLLKRSLEKGGVRYLVDNRWFKQWKKYVGYENWDKAMAGEQSSYPGPIDNTPLFKVDQPGEIKDHLIEDIDYVFLPKEGWDMLHTIYGITEGQEPIIRNIVENGLYVKLCQVEVYLLEFKLCECTNLDKGFNKSFSKVDAVESIEKEMRNLFNIPEEKATRLWNCYTNCTYEQIAKKDTSIQDAGLYTGQVIIIEQQNEDGTWPWQAKSTSSVYNYPSNENKTVYSSSGSSSVVSTRYGAMGGYGSNYNYNYNESGAGDVQPGLCGLSNLGNTCFMNSALQCMSNTPPITRFFLDDQYWEQLNTENPLGMKGEIAKSYGELVKTMWSGKYTCTAPRPFKMQVGRFAPQFSGYQQQDSQELMAFLLDGLHEDLNRIKKKPYIELRDANGRTDEVVAKEAWDNYRKRNDSIIVDLFHGLLKSTLVCPEPDCGKVSVTFDPFCYLTLPLPIKKERQIDVFFMSRDCASPITQYKLTVPKAGNVSDLCAALSRFVDVPANKLIVTDVYNHKFHKIFGPDDALSIIMERDSIYIYEVSVTSMEDPETVVLPVYMRQKRLLPSCSNDSRPGYHLFGQPIVVDVPRQKCTCETLYNIILKQMSRYVKVPTLDNEWWLKKDDNMVNGEVTMLNGDDEDESDSQADEENKEEDEGIDSQEELDYDDKHHHMFTMHFVNSSGSTDVEKIKDDGQYIKFSSRPYLSIDWHPRAKDLFFDEKLANYLEQHESASNCNRIQQKRPVIQLSECLELYTAMERLSAEDSWYCPGCKMHQQATKKFDLWSLPQVLVLCFKRFSYNRYMRDKLDTLVEFPTKNLNMAKYIINGAHGPAIYDLIAVSNHYGGMGGGHYTAYCKNKDDQKWYYFDDSSVSPTKEEDVVSKAAYVLFYTLRDPRAAENVQPTAREIPAALGTPSLDAKETQDNGISMGTSSDEDCSMDTN